jgi:hypothetical protein
VQDQGEGILREVVARAFDEPFSTGEAILRKERAGAGLGLHMARKLVVEHGGVIWADPLPGGGTRVSFCIPPIAAGGPVRDLGPEGAATVSERPPDRPLATATDGPDPAGGSLRPPLA